MTASSSERPSSDGSAMISSTIPTPDVPASPMSPVTITVAESSVESDARSWASFTKPRKK